MPRNFAIPTSLLDDILSIPDSIEVEVGQTYNFPDEVELTFLQTLDATYTQSEAAVVDDPVGGDYLAAPDNLLTQAQSGFDDISNIDFKSNWDVVDGQLTTLGVSSKAAALSFDAATPIGDPYFVTVRNFEPIEASTTTFRLNLNGDALTNARQLSSGWQGYTYHEATQDAVGDYTAFEMRPKNGTSMGTFDGVEVYNLSATDPTTTPCDVLIIGGDSNSANATSDFVTSTNRETPFDPRIWYLPTLRISSTYANAGVERHVPHPMIEPVVCATGARRMSPQHAAASRIVEWSAARGRPLLVMALGDPGTGLENTQDWRRPDRAVIETPQQESTASRMWNEMATMKSVVDGLGPQHTFIGAIWSLGQNDQFGTIDPEGYENSQTGVYSDFFSDVRELFGNIPMVMTNVSPHAAALSDASGDLGRGSYQQAWINKFDKDSGTANAISNFKVVQPVNNAPLLPEDHSDPHYSGTGIQENGRRMGDALLSLLES